MYADPNVHFRSLTLRILFSSPYIQLGTYITYTYHRLIRYFFFFFLFFLSFLLARLHHTMGIHNNKSISDTHKQLHSCLFVSSWTLSRASQPCRMASFYEGNLHKQLATRSLKHETGGNKVPPSHRFNSFYYIIVIRIGLRPFCCKQRITLQL